MYYSLLDYYILCYSLFGYYMCYAIAYRVIIVMLYYSLQGYYSYGLL